MIRNFRRWLRRDEGVTAIEFSLVCLPMFTMIIGIIEMCMFFASATVLEGASTEAARRIRTGQVAGAGEGLTDPAAIEQAERDAFVELMCDNVALLMNCNDIQYQVIAMDNDTFTQASEYEPEIDDEGNMVEQPFSVGGANSVILVRTYYKWEFKTPFISTMLTGDVAKNWVANMSTVVIRTEPYETE